MSTETRTLETIQQEYAKLCSQAGHTQYQIMLLESSLGAINEQLKKLNNEAAALATAPKQEE